MVVHATARLTATKTSQIEKSKFLGSLYVDRVSAYARCAALADLRFLGTRKRAGYFRLAMKAEGMVARSANKRIYVGSSCSSSGRDFLRAGNTVLWDWKLLPNFGASSTYRVRIMSPYVLVPLPMGVLALNGKAYGRIRASVTAQFNPCAGRVNMNGDAAVSGDGRVSAGYFSAWGVGWVDEATFYAQEQRLELRNLTVQPGINGKLSGAGRTGFVFLHRGAMRGYVKLKALVNVFVIIGVAVVPISKTLVNWSKSATVTQIL